MEFEFELPPALRTSQTRITEITAATLQPPKSKVALGRNWSDLAVIIDTMGAASAKAQKLPQVITTSTRLGSSGHRLYLLRDVQASRTVVLGFIKTGEKKLFLYDDAGKMHERTPTCVLDFYVHESCQRTGLGRELFDHMIQAEGIEPWQLAIDRPSHKFLSFFDRHFKLNSYTKQSNNFVVFRQFFSKNAKGGSGNRGDKNATPARARDSTPARDNYQTPAPAMNPPSRYGHTPGSQFKSSVGLSAALGYSPKPSPRTSAKR